MRSTCPLRNFRRLNEERAERGEPLYANPRNTGAGTIRQLDPKVTAARNMRIWVYSLNSTEGVESIEGHWEALEWLGSVGFRINPENRLCHTLEEVRDYYQSWLERRHDLPYEVDGVVVKVSPLALQDQLGVVGREPRWAIAYKFPAEQATTKLLRIGINVGRTGSLNPYAVLEPVLVSGATVQHASLHNEEDIHRKDIRVGDTVIVERAGDVIPQVVGPVPAARTGNEQVFHMPERCPECDSLVVKNEDDAMHRCPNPSCPAQFFELLKHFVSKGAADIDGLGERWCAILIEKGMVSDVADLYRMEKARLLELDRMGDKLATRIMDNIEASKHRPLPRLLFAMGITHVGSEVADLLSQNYLGVTELSAATVEDLTEVEGIGPKIAESIIDWFRDPANQKVLEKLRSSGVRLQQDSLPSAVVAATDATPLVGLTFVVTGTLSAFSRSEAEGRLKGLGGKVTSSVTKRTSYVVVGESPGSKAANAEKLGILFWTRMHSCASLKHRHHSCLRKRRGSLPDTTIIVGLGNPGPKYADTRHNVGWKVLDLVARQLQISVNERRPKAVLGAGYHDGKRVVLAKPRTFMNNSGEAVEYLLSRFGGDGSNLLVIYDEMALLPGRIRLRAAGSDAGHNGIRSIIQAVGGTGFPRLRIGIGAPPAGLIAREYVLRKFDDEETVAINEAVERASEAVQCVLKESIDAAMNKFNQDPKAASTPRTETKCPEEPGDGSRLGASEVPSSHQSHNQHSEGSHTGK